MVNHFRQFTATVTKNLIEKRRNIRITCCEMFSHWFLLILLLLGVGLSKIVYYQPENYVKFDVLVPNNVLQGRQSNVAAVDADDYVQSGGTKSLKLGGGGGRNVSSAGRSSPFSLNFGNLVGGIKRQMKGPLIIPPFDWFVTGAQFMTQVARSVPTLGYYIRQSSVGQTFGNILDFGDLHFAPRSKATSSLIKYLNTTTTTFKRIKSFVHASEDDAVAYILNHLERRTFALIVVRDVSPHKVNYVIRLNYTTLPNSNLIVNRISRGLDKGFQGYLLSGFLTMEQTVDQWALNYAVQQVDPKATCTVPDVVTVPMPTYAFDSNLFYASVGTLLGLALTMSTLYPVARLVKTVVEEKETKMREVMKIMGLSDVAHHLSWWFTSFLLFLWIAISSAIIAHGSFLPYTDKYVLFLYFFLFDMAVMNQGRVHVLSHHHAPSHKAHTFTSARLTYPPPPPPPLPQRSS